MIAEYIYVDEKRINSYYEQIADPLLYDRIRNWTYGISLTGPKFEQKAIRNPRQPTMHEKVRKVVEHIAKNKMVEARESADPSRRKPFGLARLFMYPVVVRCDFEGVEHIKLWIAARRGRRYNTMPFDMGLFTAMDPWLSNRRLILVQDSVTPDQDKPTRLSAYSLLQAILDERAAAPRTFSTEGPLFQFWKILKT